MTDLAWEVAELRRRLDNVVRACTVAEVDFDRCVVRCRYAGDADDPALSGWLPWLTRRAGRDQEMWTPSVGEQALLLAPGGDLANAICLPAICTPGASPTGATEGQHVVAYGDGAETVYDGDAHTLSHTAEDGAILEYDAGAHHLVATLPGNGTVEIDARGGVAIVGDVTVTGSISATEQVSDENGSMEEMRGVYNGHVHPAGTPPSNVGPVSREMT